MARVLFMMPESVDLLLTKEEVREYDDNDLLHLIAVTDAIMFKRSLTDTEKHNFWLVIDERRERQQ